MLASFRRMSKSKIGTGIMAIVLLTIVASFAYGDLANFGTGLPGFSLGKSTLAKVGGEEISEHEVSEAMQRRLQQVRDQNPQADYKAIAGDFEPLLQSLIDQRALVAFADKYGFNISKPLLDAEIADLPGVRGLNGKPDVRGYQAFLAQTRLSDAEVRQVLAAQIIARYLLIPATDQARVPVGVAKPYTAMLLEEREGEAAVLPFTAFTAGLKPTDAELTRYLDTNRARYMVPEQRELRFARIGLDQVGAIAATDQEIAAYYNKNRAFYAPRETRDLTQVLVPDQATAAGIAARAKGGAALAKAAEPAGAKAAITAPKAQTQAAYASVGGGPIANAVFAAASGAVIGPLKSDFGWVVVKVDAIHTTGGKSLEAARAEIAAKLADDKRKQAVEDLVDKAQDAIENGSNFEQVAQQLKLPVTTTPLVTADGTSRADAGYKFPPELIAGLKTGFDLGPNDDPEIVTLPDKSYVLVAPGRIVASAPPPLAEVRERVTADWVMGLALVKARAAANAISAEANAGASLADAVKASGAAVPIQPLQARRGELQQANPQALPALSALFKLGAGKSQVVPDTQGRGFFVIKVDKITPGNPILAVQLIGRTQLGLQQTASDEYARQFLNSIAQHLKVQRNEKSINDLKQRLISGG
jgi:peptidyl-prolyl cis-trans isomerase D